MTSSLTRRGLLAGGGAAALVVAVGGIGASRPSAPHSANAAAADYVKLLTEVHDDYVNGHIAEHNGWILSQHELETLPARLKQAATAAKAAAAKP